MMIRTDDQLHQVQPSLQKLWQFLEAARRTHSVADYEQLAAPYLLQIQQRQQEILEYLTTNAEDVELA